MKRGTSPDRQGDKGSPALARGKLFYTIFCPDVTKYGENGEKKAAFAVRKLLKVFDA